MQVTFNLLTAVLFLFCASESISESMSSGSKALTSPSGAPRSFTVDRTSPLSIAWLALPLLKGVRIKHLLPDSMGELLDLVREKDPLLEDTTKPFFMKVARNPFTEEGAMRLPYYARVSVKVRVLLQC
jgi:hypothetical protein